MYNFNKEQWERLSEGLNELMASNIKLAFGKDTPQDIKETSEKKLKEDNDLLKIVLDEIEKIK